MSFQSLVLDLGKGVEELGGEFGDSSLGLVGSVAVEEMDSVDSVEDLHSLSDLSLGAELDDSIFNNDKKRIRRVCLPSAASCSTSSWFSPAHCMSNLVER